jgi:hypothetical protein
MPLCCCSATIGGDQESASCCHTTPDDTQDDSDSCACDAYVAKDKVEPIKICGSTASSIDPEMVEQTYAPFPDVTSSVQITSQIATSDPPRSFMLRYSRWLI